MAAWKESYIRSLDLHEIRDSKARNNIEFTIRKYLEKTQMTDALRKIPLIQDLVKNLKEDITDPNVIEAIEHVKTKLEEKKYGPPTLRDLFEYSPKGSEYRVPPVFFEHPQIRRIRVLKTVVSRRGEKPIDTEVLDINQLKIHHVLGNLDWKIVNREEVPTKILCGPVQYDWEKGFKYVLINPIDTKYPHSFNVKDFDGVFHLTPNSISMRVVPRGVLPQDGVFFCPSCYNLYDDDEISEQLFRETQLRISNKLRNLAIEGINERWNFCPYCSRKALLSNDPKEIERTLLFSYLYRSNLYPDVVPLVERHAYVDKTSTKKITHKDKTLAHLLGYPVVSNARISELIEGFTRIVGIHRSERDLPRRPIYLWQQRNLRKGDKNIYYYYQVGAQKFPSRISIEMEDTDSFSFNIPSIQDISVQSMRTSLILDLVASTVRILLKQEFPTANIFALDAACEAIFSYFLLSKEMKIPNKPEVLHRDVFQCIKSLHLELCELRDSCKRQSVEFQLMTLPSIKQLVASIPLDLAGLHEKVDFQNGQENLQISKKLALIFRLFNVGEKRGNLHISSNKRHIGLELDVLTERILGLSQSLEGFATLVTGLISDIYLHTLAHLLYRSTIEVSKCDENDVSYNYDPSGEIIIYDNHSGGAGFVKECQECFDNLEYEIRIRPKFGLLQQFESDSGLCTNYLANLLIYEGTSTLKVEDLRHLTNEDPTTIVKQIQSAFNLTEVVIERVLTRTYGRNLFSLLNSLLKRKVGIMYHLLKETFKFRYDDLVLIQQCPTISLFMLLCKLDDHKLAILLQEVFRERVSSSQDSQKFSLLEGMWNEIFESNYGILFSKFNQDLMPKFEDMTSTCIKGCYDCVHISFGCKHSVMEQDFRTNTHLTRLVLSEIREKHSLKFPDTNNTVHQTLEKAKSKEAMYFHFVIKDFPQIERFFNTFLSKCLTYDLEPCQPFFSFDIEQNRIRAYVKMRKRIRK